MPWQLILSISIFTTSFFTRLQRVMMKDTKNDPIAYAICSQLLSGVFIGIFALLRGFHMPDLLLFIPNIIILMICFSVGNMCIFHALKYIEASEFTILFLTNGIWTAITAITFLKEVFSVMQIIGTVLILLSVYLVTKKTKNFVLGKGAFLSLLGAFLFGIGFTNSAYMIKYFDSPSFLVFSFVLSGLSIALLSSRSFSHAKIFLVKRNFLQLSLFSFLFAIATITLFLAYQFGKNAAQIGILNQTSTIITVIFSIIFLKETSDLWRKILGAIAGFIGIVLITGITV